MKLAAAALRSQRQPARHRGEGNLLILETDKDREEK